MGIELSLTNVLTFTVTDEDIPDFLSVFTKLVAARKETGYVKAADLSDQEWEVVEAVGNSLIELS